jgi:hypothetical protein
MKKVTIIVAAALALAAVYVFGDWVYEGQWGSLGSGDGELEFRDILHDFSDGKLTSWKHN